MSERNDDHAPPANEPGDGAGDPPGASGTDDPRPDDGDASNGEGGEGGEGGEPREQIGLFDGAPPLSIVSAKESNRKANVGVRLEEVAPGIAAIVFDATDRSVNILTHDVLQRLRDLIRSIRSSTHFRAVLVKSDKTDSFIAGADVSEIADVTDPTVGRQAAALGQSIFQELADLPIPVVAAINGTCLGGGTELALACHYRVAADGPSVRIGLPEVRLGIIPGFGGTQRLPRLIGLPMALDMVLSSRNLNAKRARRAGLVDAVVPAALFATEALRVAERAAAGAEPARGIPAFRGPKKAQSRRTKLSARDKFLESPAGLPLLFRESRKTVMAKTKGFYVAPLKALEVMREGWRKPLIDALAIEAEAIGELVAGEEKRALTHVFFLTEANKRERGAPESVRPVDIRRAGLLGAGVMGGGIAQLASYRDIAVRMRDINDDGLLNGLRAASDVYQRLVKRRRLTRRDAARRLALIKPTLDYSGFGKVDLVFEAVVENMDVKKAVLKEVEAVTRNDVIFATNTSALSVTELATASSRPEFVAGFHFFNPVHRMPLIEVIRGERTSDHTVATLMHLARRLGKTPILCQDGPGFLVNRILGRYLNEAGHLLADGLSVSRCDEIALAFGMPMGPVRLIDEIGVDVAAKVGTILATELGSRFHANNLLEHLVGEGLLGAKSGAGFYLAADRRRPRFGKKRPERVNPKAAALIETGGTVFAGSDQEVLDRLILVMVDEAARCLDDRIVARSGDVDLGMIFGTGFPPFRGGLLRYADTIGLERVTDALTRLAETVDPRFLPCDRLKAMGARGETFYATRNAVVLPLETDAT